MLPANIIRSRPRIKPEDDVVAFCDTVQVFFETYPHIPKGRWLGFIAKGKKWGWLLTVQQPTPRQLLALDKLNGSVARVDIAADYCHHHRMRLRNWIAQHAVLTRSRRWPMKDIEATTYWVEYPRGKRRGNRQLVIYADRTSKLNGQPCVHLELRLLTAKEVKRAGVSKPSDILNMNPAKLFRDNTEWQTFDLNQYVRSQRGTGYTAKRITYNLARHTQCRCQNIRSLYPHIPLKMIRDSDVCIPFELQLIFSQTMKQRRDHAARGKTWAG